MPTIREFISKLRGEGGEKDGLKDYVKELSKQKRANEIVEERSKSANLRELERLYKEIEDKKIKDELEYMRKRRQKDIEFSHNPIHTKYILKGGHEILKDRHLFTNNGNMFTNQKNIFVPKRRKRR